MRIWLGSSRGAGLEFHPHPAVALVAALEAACDHGVGKGEEGGVVAAPFTEAFDIEGKLTVEHRLKPGAGHVAVAGAVDGIADGHVVGRDALRDRACRRADAEEPTNDLLAGTDLGKRAVPAGIEVDPQGFLVGIKFVGAHACTGTRWLAARLATSEPV